MTKTYRLLCSADRWWALFDSEGRPLLAPLACWAVAEVARVDDDEIVGLVVDPDGKVQPAPECENFVTYVHESELDQVEQLLRDRKH